MAYGDLAYGDKDLAKRTAADKILRDSAFNIAKDPKYDRYQRRLADKKTAGSRLSYTIKSTPKNKLLAEELQKPIIRKFKK